MVPDAEHELWDDEIERLVKAASGIYEVQMVAALVEQAVRRLIEVNRGKKRLNVNDIRSAMKAELRRLLVPQ